MQCVLNRVIVLIPQTITRRSLAYSDQFRISHILMHDERPPAPFCEIPIYEYITITFLSCDSTNPINFNEVRNRPFSPALSSHRQVVLSNVTYCSNHSGKQELFRLQHAYPSQPRIQSSHGTSCPHPETS